MRRRDVLKLGALSLLVPPTPPPRRPLSLPPRAPRDASPPRPDFRERAERLAAVAVSLEGVGMRTHANWVLFRLPFDWVDAERVRVHEVSVGASVETNLAALRLGSVCTAFRRYGPASTWTLYSEAGFDPTMPFSSHPAPPSRDPDVLGVNVPTRVANHIACGLGGDALREPSTWWLDVRWSER